VRAMTRHPDGRAAQLLRDLGAEVVKGDLDSRSSLDCVLEGAYGVFGVTDFGEHEYDPEVHQGRMLVDAAVATGVRHFVFSSVGGIERTKGLGIAHFDSKRMIEAHLRQAGLVSTIFRFVTFFENFVTLRIRKAICERGVFRFAVYPAKPIQMVAMDDVGIFVAKAFEYPVRYGGAALELASDRFTMLDFVAELSEAVSRPVRYQYLPIPVQRMIITYVELTRTAG
jgi:uncharacterized protein YbjT (DUF2867 family)